MAKVMLREKDGKVKFYVAKKDMEETILSIEFDTDEKWGGEVKISNGDTWLIPVGPKKLPCELEVKRLSIGGE
jgi:nitrogen fixation protein NifT